LSRLGARPVAWLGATLLAIASLNAVTKRGAPDSGEATARAPSAPLLLVGLDAFEWDVALPLLGRGELPHLARLMERGVYGELATARPTLSPILWTSIVTGKDRSQHGIRGFVREAAPDEGGVRLFNSHDRRTKALWNILSDHRRRVAVVGWYMTFPVEDVNGAMVAQTQTPDQSDRRQGRAIMAGRLVENLPGQVHPAELEPEIMAIRRRVVERLPTVTREIFGEFRHPQGLLTRTHWTNSTWSVEADLVFLSVAEHLLAQRSGYDALLVYASGADVLGHRFWRHHDPTSFAHPPSREEIEDFGERLRDYYRFLDAWIGALQAANPGEETVMVISDHGMHATNRDVDFDVDALPDDMNRVHSGHHEDAPPGVFIAAGPGIRHEAESKPIHLLTRDDLRPIGTIFDVAPSVLGLFGIPKGRDMKGHVLEEVLARPEAAPRAIASHDDPAWRSARMPLSGDGIRSPGDDERMQQLRALGYVQ
jgi:hypothetical protein